MNGWPRASTTHAFLRLRNAFEGPSKRWPPAVAVASRARRCKNERDRVGACRSTQEHTKAMRKRPSRGFPLALLAAGTLSIPAYGQTAAVPAQIYMQSVPWASPLGPTVLPYWGYWYSPCYPFASCMTYQQFQILERRQERWDELRRGPQLRAAESVPARAATPPVNDADVKPEYKGSGEYLPEFLDGRVRPSQLR